MQGVGWSAGEVQVQVKDRCTLAHCPHWSLGAHWVHSAQSSVQCARGRTGSSRYLWTCQGLPIPCGWRPGRSSAPQSWLYRLATVNQVSSATKMEWSGRWQRVQTTGQERKECKWESGLFFALGMTQFYQILTFSNLVHWLSHVGLI